MTFENLEVWDQAVAGLVNDGQTVSIRGFQSRNSVPETLAKATARNLPIGKIAEYLSGQTVTAPGSKRRLTPGNPSSIRRMAHGTLQARSSCGATFVGSSVVRRVWSSPTGTRPAS